MGYSSTQMASFRLDAISARCVKETGQSNVFYLKNVECFFEIGQEQSDGAITGQIYTMSGEKKGSFRIEPNGAVARGPAFFRVPALILEVDGQPTLYRGSTDPKKLVGNLGIYLADEWVQQYKVGGVNYHISQSLGYIPYPNRAALYELGGQEIHRVLDRWKAAPFQVW